MATSSYVVARVHICSQHIFSFRPLSIALQRGVYEWEGQASLHFRHRLHMVCRTYGVSGHISHLPFRFPRFIALISRFPRLISVILAQLTRHYVDLYLHLFLAATKQLHLYDTP